MAKKASPIEKIDLKGLTIAPSQIWGAVRLVPLIRKQQRADLRLLKQNYKQDLTFVEVEKDIYYSSYIPHGLVVTWSEGKPDVAMGGQLFKSKQKHSHNVSKIGMMHRMVKRESKNALRMLPLHLAMEGFLAMHFNAPEIAWQEYSKRAISRGLSPRVEYSVSGRGINTYEDALRLFEIHQHQVGVLVFIGEVLASAFIVPTHQDYRALHNSLLEDFYGETFYYCGLYGKAYDLESTINEKKINSFEDLEKAIATVRQEWADFQGFMAADILEREIKSTRVYTAGNFSLQRFITDLSLWGNNYIGETIVDELGIVQYLKIYGLSKAQTKRAYLLQTLAANKWNLEQTANSLGDRFEHFIKRIENAGFGYLINNQVREQCAKKRKQGK